MRDSVMWFLVMGVVVTSLFTVYVRHQHRIAYSVFQAEESRRDDINDDWGRLIIEGSTWAFPHYVEKGATEKLSMRAPTAKEVQFIDLLVDISESEPSESNGSTQEKLPKDNAKVAGGQHVGG